MGKLSRACAVGAAVVLGLVLWHIPAYGAIGASATITPSQLGPSSYEYAMTLTNTGTTPIGTFWFAWFPGYDLLPHAPSAIKSPAVGELSQKGLLFWRSGSDRCVVVVRISCGVTRI